MTAESHPNSPARPKTYRLLLSNPELQEVLAHHLFARYGLSKDVAAKVETLTVIDHVTGKVEQIRVEVTVSV
jgi:hypothetical protein